MRAPSWKKSDKLWTSVSQKPCNGKFFRLIHFTKLPMGNTCDFSWRHRWSDIPVKIRQVERHIGKIWKILCVIYTKIHRQKCFFWRHRWRNSAAILFFSVFKKKSSSPEGLGRLRWNFTGTFPLRSSFKFVNLLLIRHMVWRPSWKNPKTFKHLLLQKRWSNEGEISDLYSWHACDASLLISKW